MTTTETRPIRRRLAGLLGSVLLLAAAAAAVEAQEKAADPVGPPPEADRKALALTVYSSADPSSFDPRQSSRGAYNPYNNPVPGYGVVRETRTVGLAEGESAVRFTDVAAQIDPTTVAFKSLTAPDSTAVLEQDYQYDLVATEKLLQKYLGLPIGVRLKGLPEARATLLSADAGGLVLQEPEGALRLISRNVDLEEIDLPKLPKGLITKPTLVWKVAAKQGGPHDVQVSYQTGGMTWRADYNLVVAKGDATADLAAWVTLLNESGASYPEAKLKLVAGDVQRVQPQQRGGYAPMAMAKADRAAAPGFEEKSFSDYHLYTLGRPTSLAENSIKQIELFPVRPGVPVRKTYVYYGLDVSLRGFMAPSINQDRDLGTSSNKKVDTYLRFKNDEASRLGVPLPAGRVRVYQRDEADAALEFVGEDAIDHTPKNEELVIKLGSAFDVVGDRKQTDFRVDNRNRTVTESFEITLRNQKAEAIKVVVKENFYRWTNWEIIRQTDSPEKQDVRTVHFPVEVKPGEPRTVTYTVRYHW